MNLTDYPWRISYSSNENNPIADFYIPALECAVKYDRKSGFFNSAILSKVARGLGAMLHNHGEMRLIMGCQFSPQDLQAIQQGYALRDAVTIRLDADLQPPKTFAQLKHFEVLSWLIQNSYLDIKIAIPLKSNGLPVDSDSLLDRQHMFHEKVGIFTDSSGAQLAFSGSNNESLSGWESNVESFHVYCAWEGGRDAERVGEEIFRFEQLWNNLSPNVRVFEVPEAVKNKLLSYAPSSKPVWNREEEVNATPPGVNATPPRFDPPLPPPTGEIQKEEGRAKSSAEFPMPNSQCPIPDAPFPIPNYRLPIIDPGKLTMSVNLSPKQLGMPNLLERVDEILAETGCDPSCLKLEITESAIVENVQKVNTVLTQLKAKNIRLSIDDFGTGYSSLSYLHRFPLDTLKIDRSFVSRLGTSEDGNDGSQHLQIVRAIVTLAHNLGLEAIAEGVETAEQLAQLRDLGCELAQGYWFSKPLDGNTITEMLKRSIDS